MPEKVLRVVGANAHNLKNITVEIPRDKLVVITGLSGSGKSSLAFDTIFAEGQRRYVESLSAYARQFLGQMEKPDVDYIEGLSPAVSIDQKGHLATTRAPPSAPSPKSTTTCACSSPAPASPTARNAAGRSCANPPRRSWTPSKAMPEGSRLLVLAPLVKHRKGTHQDVLEEIRKAGFVRARVDGDSLRPWEEEIELDRYKNHTIEAVVDRLVVRQARRPAKKPTTSAPA